MSSAKGKGAAEKRRREDGDDGASTVASMYKKLNHREHVLLRPGMYVGSVESDPTQAWVFDNASQRMVFRQIQYVPALYKIFDEILMNAVDHATRLKKQATDGVKAVANFVKNIRVEIDRSTGTIKVTNDGEGIDVEMHQEHGCYVPELIFGHLLTSANYDDGDESERTIGGQNGIGAKACNIFSSAFVIETVDAGRKKIYTQRFCDNMQTVSPPVIKACQKKPYTSITFTPDYARFGMPGGLTDDMHALMVKRVYDATAVTEAEVSVHLDGTKLDCKTFERYVDLYIGDRSDSVRIYEKLNDRFEVVVACSPDGMGMQHVSFVNGVWTMRGGKHVDYVVGMVARKLSELIEERKKGVSIKTQYVRENLFVFLKSTIPNPAFDSQSKETLTTPSNKFGCRVDITDKFIEKLYKLELVERAISLSEATSNKNLKKTDGKKSSTITGIPKLDDANWAGTAKSAQCTLILTEGDSAKSMAISGLDQVGRDRFGVYPLRGKVMNVCDVSAQKIADNKEISELKKILGLETGKVYQSTADLRYGRIMALTDADHDGSHIKGLIMNLFQQMWPSLLKVEGFVTSMLTPIVKARKMQGGKEVVMEFFNLNDFDKWRAEHGSERGWEIKYYKGLGTSTAKEAKEYFKKMRMVVYRHCGDESDDILDLAFNKKRADDRKAWLMSYDKNATLDYGNSDVSYVHFVHKDLRHFSNYDLVRSIPSVVDGLKVSQRKVLYAVLKKGITKHEVRVASLSGIVQSEAAYHHGDASLNGTIIGLAQNFVGSNNIHLLQPNGQFGTRIQGGKDAASPRYIHTLLSPIASKIFIKDDDAVLAYLDDDGQQVEPEYYLPIVPMVLVNGAIGIGTGFSTNVPSFNPSDVLRAVRMYLDGRDAAADVVATMGPWYRGFTGKIEQVDVNRYFSKGRYTRPTPNSVSIVELPIGTWTEDFKELLDDLVQKEPDVKKFDSNYGDDTVAFTLHFASKDALDAWLAPTEAAAGAGGVAAAACCRLEKDLKLASNKYMSTNNMYLFDSEGRIKKYNNILEIVEDFCIVRLAAYSDRKQRVLAASARSILILEGKVRFLCEVIAGDLNISSVSKARLEEMLKERAYTTVDDAYDYLVRMPIYSLTEDKKHELEAELEAAKAGHAAYEATEPKQLWRMDLDALEKALTTA